MLFSVLYYKALDLFEPLKWQNCEIFGLTLNTQHFFSFLSRSYTFINAWYMLDLSSSVISQQFVNIYLEYFYPWKETDSVCVLKWKSIS